MPIYPYVCTECGHEFDALQKVSEDPLKDCPECGTSSLRKRLAAPAFQLKGSGWYETDFKNSGKSKSDSKKEGDGKEGKDAAGTDSKEGKSKESKDSAGASTGGESRPAAAAGKDD